MKFSHTEALSAGVTFSIPDWFGEGEDFSWYDTRYWRNISGNRAWDRLYKGLTAHGIDLDKTCADPMGKWVSVHLDPDQDLSRQALRVGIVLQKLIEEEEKRHAESQKNPQGGGTGADEDTQD